MRWKYTKPPVIPCQKGTFLKQPTVSAPPHSSLGYLTPVEFEHQWLAQQGVLEVVH